MLEERKVLVYPFDRGFSPLVRYDDYLYRKARFNSLVSPSGFALAGHDAGYANGVQTGMLVSKDLEKAIEDNDIFLLANGHWNLNLRKKAIESMMRAASMHKEIWCTILLSDEELENIRESCRQNDTEFTYFYHPANENFVLDTKLSRLRRPKSAIIFVGEVMPGLDAYAIMLSLYKSFSNAGYRVCAVGDRSDCELFGIHSMPYFLRNSVGEDLKIYGFNQYICELEEKEESAVIIIQLPGALIKYNNQLINGGGVLSYIVSQALQPDYMVTCVPFDTNECNSFVSLSETFLYKFGFGIDFIHMSNARVDSVQSMIDALMIYDYPDVGIVTKELSKNNTDFGIPVCNILDNNHESLFLHAENKLTGYIPSVKW